MSGSSASVSPASAPAPAQQSCPLFATHFVRNGIFNYAIVQGDKSVQYATFSISERQSNSSIATRTYSGRADKPVALYQWTQEESAATAADAPETASSDAASVAPAAAAYGSSSNGLCFTFPVNKGCTYFIQIDFGLTSCAGGSSSTIHWFVDPNKRRLVPKGTAAAAASKKRIADNDASSSAAPASSSSSAASDAAANPAAEPSSAAKKPRKAAAAAAAAGGKSSSAASKTAAGASAISVQA